VIIDSNKIKKHREPQEEISKEWISSPNSPTFK